MKSLEELELEKEQKLEEQNKQYDDLLNERNELDQQQNQMVDSWQSTQNDVLDKQLAHQKELMEQNKAEAEKRYENEAKSAYTDYRKENDSYGVSREQMANMGMGNTGYSESSRVGMYNAYQNRLGTARQSMDKAYLEFNNAIKEAQLANDVGKAENALKALQQKLQISLEGFGYKDTTTKDKIAMGNQLDSKYYNRYQNTLNQLNYQKEQEENRKRYEQEREYQKQQDIINQQRWEQEMAYRKEQDQEEKRRYEQEMAYRRQQDARANAIRQSASRTPKYNAPSLDTPSLEVVEETPQLSKFAQDMVKYYEKIDKKPDGIHNTRQSKEATLAYAYQQGQINEADLRYLSDLLGL